MTSAGSPWCRVCWVPHGFSVRCVGLSELLVRHCSALSGRRRPITGYPKGATRGTWAQGDTGPRSSKVSQRERQARAQTAIPGRTTAISQAPSSSSPSSVGRDHQHGPAFPAIGSASSPEPSTAAQLPNLQGAVRGIDGSHTDHNQYDEATTTKEKSRSVRIGSIDNAAIRRGSIRAGAPGRNNPKGRPTQLARRTAKEQLTSPASLGVHRASGRKAAVGSLCLSGQSGKGNGRTSLEEGESPASQAGGKKDRRRKRDNASCTSDSSSGSEESDEASENEEQEESEEEEEEEALGAKSEGRKRAPSLKTEQQLEERYRTQGRYGPWHNLLRSHATLGPP